MNNPTSENATPESIRLPEKPIHEDRPGDVVVISQATLYYGLTAILFFVAGFAIAWVVFATRADDIKAVASSAAREAVSTAIAGMAVSGNGAVQQVQPTPIGRQTINVSNTMPAWGPADAKVTLVEFSDFQCPYCELWFQRVYPKLKQNYGDKIHFVYRHFPLGAPMHPDSEPAALAAECAKEQNKFWEYHDVLFSNQSDLSRGALIKYAGDVKVGNVDQFTKCFDTQKFKQIVDSDFNEGAGYSVNGTPTFFINGNILVGAQDYSVFASMIDKELQSASGR
ncbi:MAG: DsbA family protein [Chloroflexota bacterium]